MAIRVTKLKQPKAMRNIGAQMRQFKEAKRSELVASVAKDLARAGLDVNATPKYVVATETKMRKRGIIDLKPIFARSPKRKLKKHGGWFIVVPISIKARSFATSTIYKRALSEFSDLGAGETATASVKDFMKGRTQNTIQALQYKPKSNNITATKNETGKRTSYKAFRTISDKSPANSWIVGREGANNSNTSKTLQKDIERLLRWKYRKLMGGDK